MDYQELRDYITALNHLTNEILRDATGPEAKTAEEYNAKAALMGKIDIKKLAEAIIEEDPILGTDLAVALRIAANKYLETRIQKDITSKKDL